MGFTRYWNRTEAPITEEFVNEVNAIIENCISKGIGICGWDGTGKPEVSTEIISFNGNGEKGLDHETLLIGKETGFNFCKTAYKPYDYAVREVLRVAERYGIITDVRSDGEYEEIYSDDEFLEE